MSVEEEILNIMEEDARASYEEIGDMVGLSAGEVEEKVVALRKKGIIRKFKAVVNWEKFGREEVYALIDVKIQPERERGYDSIAERLMGFQEVKNLFLVSGMYDLSVLVEAPTMKEVSGFVSEKLAPLPQVASTTTHFILKKYKEDGDVLFSREEGERQPISP